MKVINEVTDNLDLYEIARWGLERDTQWWENEIVLIDDSDVEILSVKALSKLDYLFT
jgi:hypothetical protein